MNDALKEQLKELNNRARWYSGQLWYIPYAYFGLTGIAISNVVVKQSVYIGGTLIACGILGLFVLWHMWLIKDGEKRAVENLLLVEIALGLEPTVDYKGYTKPFFIGVSLVALLSSLGGLVLLNG
ncbi:hypothetical protein [Dechloromonas sp. H13]|uniref:hypothetical protein n=1 Tax=Dechloromonas sp. H13 TaxID=2570193 RepID=UPI0012925C20|nr:hypothetical protein [Dechloromonas sp. H13]